MALFLENEIPKEIKGTHLPLYNILFENGVLLYESKNEFKTMTHLCYVYIKTYKKLHQVGIVIDPHYQYNLNIQERCLTIEKKPSIPNYFWGEGVYSLSAIVGGNGVGKSTMLRFILDAVVEGAANQDLQGCIIFEKDGNLYKCTRNCELNIIGISNVKIISK